MWTYNTFVVLAGVAILGALCGLVGSFAVLRQRALVGDVTAHAAFPGLCLAFLITGSRQLPVLLFGALCTGLLGIWILSALRRHSRTKEDAAMAMVLAVMFGAGVSLSRHIQNAVTDGSNAGLDSFILGKTAGIVLADVWWIAGVGLVATMAIVALYKEFRLVCFDVEYARSLGWRTVWLDFGLLSLLALAVVIGLPMVGVVMVAALTIIPPVAARFWTERLGSMLAIATVTGGLAGIAGVLASATAPDLPTGPVIVLFAALWLAISATLAPRRGVLAHQSRLARQRRQQAIAMLRENFADHPLSFNEAANWLSRVGIQRPHRVLSEAVKSGHVKFQEAEMRPGGPKP